MIADNLDRLALKSGAGYAMATIINAIIVFVSTPFFTRVMSKEAFGSYNNFISWYNLFSILSLNLSATFISAKKDFEKQFSKYVHSTVIFTLVIIFFSSGVLNILYSYIEDYIVISRKHINIMFLYIAAYQIFSIYQITERFAFKYKNAAAMIIVNAILTVLLSMFFVVHCEDQLNGRIWGWAIPTIVMGFGILLRYFHQGFFPSMEHWKYAIPIALPYIPHLLSLTILNSIDRTMITNYIGMSATAVYSIAYTCGSIITLIIGAMNNAFAPWLVNQLIKGDSRSIHKVSKYYVLVFEAGLIGLLLVSPEIILILGGREYSDAIEILPAIMIGCSMQLIYTMYVNVEQYMRKIIPMAVISTIAALSNLLLNVFFIPRVGYEAAAITTLLSYVLLTVGHIWIVCKDISADLFGYKFSFGIVLLNIVLVPLFNILYEKSKVRFCLFITYIVFLAFIVKRKSNKLF